MADELQNALDGGEEALNKGVQNAIVDLVERVYKYGSSKSKSTVDKLRLRFTTKFAEYLRQTAIRCRKVKTLISRTEPINIEDAYVAVSFSSGSLPASKTFSEKALVDRLCAGEQFVISGIAGSGKSMTMRYLYLTLCKGQADLIPVFLELRHVAFQNKQDIVSYVIEQIANFTHSIERDAFLSILKDRRFVFLFDGFDEIAIEMRDRAERDILSLAKAYPLCPILVSSRPDSRFERWHSFSEAKICPLSIEQVEELIAKTKYNESTKINFVRNVKGGLYKSHKELLSNPLLATMMLMTFEEFAEIPSKMHIFYRSAFEVLFRRHDATKVDFKRQFKTELSIDDFEKVFSTFCLMSYLDSIHSFRDNSTFVKYLDKAIQYEGIAVQPNRLRDDLTDNVCIILPDGVQFAFLHRSFQEYFSAAFLANRSIEAFAEVVDAISKKDFSSTVIKFLFEMNREDFERAYLIPTLKLVVLELKAAKKRDHRRALALFFSEIMLFYGDREISFSISLNELPNRFPIFDALNKLYRVNLYKFESASSAAVELFKKECVDPDSETGNIDVKKISKELYKSLRLDRHLDAIQKTLEDFLTKKIREESVRQILLSEVLLKPKQQREH
jgi:predicted NACHT family NTPase